MVLAIDFCIFPGGTAEVAGGMSLWVLRNLDFPGGGGGSIVGDGDTDEE